MKKERRFAIIVRNPTEGMSVLERLCHLNSIRLTHIGSTGEEKVTLRKGIDFKLDGSDVPETVEEVRPSSYLIEGVVEASDGYQVLSKELSNVRVPLRIDTREVNSQGSLVRYKIA